MYLLLLRNGRENQEMLLSIRGVSHFLSVEDVFHDGALAELSALEWLVYNGPPRNHNCVFMNKPAG